MFNPINLLCCCFTSQEDPEKENLLKKNSKTSELVNRINDYNVLVSPSKEKQWIQKNVDVLAEFNLSNQDEDSHDLITNIIKAWNDKQDVKKISKEDLLNAKGFYINKMDKILKKE